MAQESNGNEAGEFNRVNEQSAVGQYGQQNPKDVIPAFPSELKNLNRWGAYRLVWNGKKYDKKPYNAETGVMGNLFTPGVPRPFAVALVGLVEYGFDGLGYGFQVADGYSGIDLDGVRDAKSGVIADWARGVIREVNSYTEVSPSGTGVHILVRGTVTKGTKLGAAEVYSNGRFFTVTGQHVEGTPTCINEYDAESFRNRVAAGEFGGIAEAKPERPKEPAASNEYLEQQYQQMRDFLDAFELAYKEHDLNGGGKKFTLDDGCVFDETHNETKTTAAIFVNHKGEFGHKCYHNTCNGGWKEFRRQVDPENVFHFDRPEVSLESVLDILIGDDAEDNQPNEPNEPELTNYLWMPKNMVGGWDYGDDWQLIDRTDAGNGLRFANQFKDSILSCPQRASNTGGWMVWNQSKWDTDDTKSVLEAVRQATCKYLRDIKREFKARRRLLAEQPKALARLKKEYIDAHEFGKTSRNYGKMQATLAEVGGTAMCVDARKFDQHPLLINLKNCTIEGSSGLAREHRKEDYLTQVISIEYNPTAKCPVW